MSRAFNGSSAYLQTGSDMPGPVGDDARAVSFWVRFNTVATRQFIYYEGSEDGVVNTRFSVELDGGNIYFNYYGDRSAGSSALSANTWYSIVINGTPGTYVGYLNGVSETASGITNAAPASPLVLGRVGALSLLYFDGQIAEVAKYNATLNPTNDILPLSKGFVPTKVRPQNLVFYAPLVRDLIDAKGALSITDNSTSVADHPRMYR